MQRKTQRAQSPSKLRPGNNNNGNGNGFGKETSRTPSRAKPRLDGHEDNMPGDSRPAGNPVEDEGYM